MTLQARLDAQRTQFEARAPKEALEIMHRATEDVRRSGILAGVPKVGQRAPDFSLPNPAGRPVSLAALRARGPVVLTFYRGKW